MTSTQAQDGEGRNDNSRIAVWLDCDPGHDDAFAIILAGHNPSLKLLGISTVAGNQTVAKTTHNALKVITIAGLEHLDVVPGQAVPLVRPSRICDEIHGESGLDCSMPFPPVCKQALDAKAVLVMFNEISKEFSLTKRPVTLICTGCLTNAALLITLFPEIKSMIKEVVLLGGAMGVGNISPVAEFNILIDPEAAKIVFECGLPVVMVPLEVSHTALVTPEVLARFDEFQGSKFSLMMRELLLFFAKTYKEVFGFEYPPLHDPLAVAYVINPELFHMKKMRVDIETSSPLCSGQTVCDIFNMADPKLPRNALVGQKVDINAFWNMMFEALKQADAVSMLNKS